MHNNASLIQNIPMGGTTSIKTLLACIKSNHNGDSGAEAHIPWSVLCHNTTSFQLSTCILCIPACVCIVGLNPKVVKALLPPAQLVR